MNWKIGSYFERVYGKSRKEMASDFGVHENTIFVWHRAGKLKHLELDQDAKNFYGLDKSEWRRAVQCYSNIRSRCEYPNDKRYQNYGGRGIKANISLKDLCFLWKRDGATNMKRPSIDRIDSAKNYEVDNCRFLEFVENQKRFRPHYLYKNFAHHIPFSNLKHLTDDKHLRAVIKLMRIKKVYYHRKPFVTIEDAYLIYKFMEKKKLCGAMIQSANRNLTFQEISDKSGISIMNLFRIKGGYGMPSPKSQLKIMNLCYQN